MNERNITSAISNCPRTGLPRVARFISKTEHSNGSVSIEYREDTLDLEGNVFQQGVESKTISYQSRAVATPEGIIEPGEPTPEFQAIMDATTPLIEAVLNTIDPQEGGDNE